jgi:hypothetical protein
MAATGVNAVNRGLGGRVAMPKVDPLLSLARDLRARAREVLAKAESMKDAGARLQMREIAAGYERLARRLEEASGGDIE